MIAIELEEREPNVKRRREIHAWMLANTKGKARAAPTDNTRFYDGNGGFTEGRTVRYEFALKADALIFKLTWGGS